MKHQYLIENKEVTVQLINYPKPVIELIVERQYLKLVVFRRAKDGLNMYTSLSHAKVRHFATIRIPYVKRVAFIVLSYHLN